MFERAYGSFLLPVCWACSRAFYRRCLNGCSSCPAPRGEPPVRVASVFLAGTAFAPDDEYTAAEQLFFLRFGPDWRCEGCAHTACTHLRTRPRIFECNRCRRSFSVTAGTALHGCRVPLVRVARAAALLSRPGTSISARRLAREIGVCIETAWSLGHRLRTGFLAPPHFRLEPPVLLSHLSLRLRPPPRQKRPDEAFPTARFTVLWDFSHRSIGLAGALDAASMRRFVDAHADVEKPTLVPGLLREDPRHIGDATHHGVSARWLPLYVASILGWQNARIEARSAQVETLWRAMRPAPRPFARLRPHAPPDRTLQAWRAQPPHTGDLELLARAGRVRPPGT